MVRQLNVTLARWRSAHLPLGLLVCTLVLAGCTTPYSGTAPRPSPRPPAAPPAPVPAPETPAEPPARPPATSTPRPAPEQSPTLALRRDSALAAARGDMYQAVALLERAIRIDPGDPQLWLELSRLHLGQGAFDEAEQMARKALSLAGNRYQLEQDAWVVIDQARAAAQR